MKAARLILHGQDLDLRTSGGVGRYSYELQRRAKSPAIAPFLGDVDVESWDFPPLDANLGKAGGLAVLTRTMRAYLPKPLFRAARRVYGLGQRRKSTPVAAVSDSRPTIFHEVTNYTASRVLFEPSRGEAFKICVTFHDLQDLYHPANFNQDTLKARRRYYDFYATRAHQFFAISEFTKRTMVERLGIPEARIKVTPLAADGFADDVAVAHVAYARRHGRYVIYPAKLWKHKNHDFLFDAFSKRRDEFRRHGIRLLLTGGFSPAERTRLREAARGAGLSDDVTVLGFESAGSFRALLQHAEFLVFPSLYEGFGLPVLEALTAGCPVLCSHQTSLPEVGGDAVVYFDATRVDSLVSVFDDVLAGRIDRELLAAKGKAQCKKFSWDRTFERTAEEYVRLV